MLCRLTGTGRIVRLWFTLPLVLQRRALKDTVLRMYWDGEEAPSVEAPLGDFFGATFGAPVALVSERLVIAGGGYLCRFELPFNDGAIIELENQASAPLRSLFFQIGWYEEPARSASEPTLHAQFRRERRARPGEPITLLKARGAGFLAGMRLDLQAEDWWLKPPVQHILLPRGFGLGVLEGWEELTVDGNACLRGTGAEDYFGGGFYFKGGPFLTPTHGCTARSFFTGRVSAYRFHVDDPVYFARSLDMTLDHGLHNTMNVDCTSVVYWYQHEPHEPFPPLPAASERRLRAPWMNVVQWLLLGLPLALLLAYWLLALRTPRAS